MLIAKKTAEWATRQSSIPLSLVEGEPINEKLLTATEVGELLEYGYAEMRDETFKPESKKVAKENKAPTGDDLETKENMDLDLPDETPDETPKPTLTDKFSSLLGGKK